MAKYASHVGLWVAVLLVASACSSADSDAGSGTTDASGFIFIDSNGSRICESMLESYPPQCGDPSVRLLDLDPGSVVALMSPSDATAAPVSWTDYTMTVEGDVTDDGLINTRPVNPTYLSGSSGLVLRVADQGILIGEPVTWPFDLTNLTDADTTLTFTSGQHIEVTLSNDSGEVYRWSDDLAFTQAIEQIDLRAGAALPYVLRSDPVDLAPGQYTARAWVTAAETSDVVVTWEVSVTSNP